MTDEHSRGSEDTPSSRRGRVFTRRNGLILLGVAVVVVLVAAFAAETVTPLLGGEKPYRLSVVRSGKELAAYDLEGLRDLGVRRELMQTGWEEGPSLPDVLRSSGVTSFERVTIEGLGVRDDGNLVLGHGEVDDHVLLDIAYRGTAKICGPDIPREERVRDVVRIIVE